MRCPEAFASRAFGIAFVADVIEPRFVHFQTIPHLYPNRCRVIRYLELFLPLVVVLLGIVIHPMSGFVGKGVSSGSAVHDGERSVVGMPPISFGSCGSDHVTTSVAGGEFFRSLASGEIHLFVTKVKIG